MRYVAESQAWVWVVAFRSALVFSRALYEAVPENRNNDEMPTARFTAAYTATTTVCSGARTEPTGWIPFT